MGILEVCMIGIGLSADAFAVSVCKGLQMKKLNTQEIKCSFSQPTLKGFAVTTCL